MRLKKAITLLLFFASDASAKVDEYTINPDKRLEVSIAEHGINRLAIDKDRFLRVIGNETEYLLEGDNTRGDIFIASKVSSGDSFAVTLISEKGIVQDLTFKVENKSEPVTILLKPSLKNINLDDSSIKSQIIASIREILTNKKQLKNYKIRHLNIQNVNKLISKLPIKLTKITEYKNKLFQIFSVEYESTAEFKSEDLRQYFPNLLAVARRGNNLIVVLKL